MLHFDHEIRIYVAFGCGLVVAVSLLIVICFILPPACICIGPRRQDDDLEDVQLKSLRRVPSDADVRSLRSISLISSHSSDPADPRNVEDAQDVSRRDSVEDRPGRWCRSNGFFSSSQSLSFQSQDSGRHSISFSSTADVDDAASITNTTVSSLSRCGSLESESEKCAHVTVHLRFDAATDATDPQLIVNVEHAGDLPGRTYMDQCDPCVTVRLERRSFSFRRGRQRDILAHAVSPTVFRSRHPLFQYIVGLPLQAHMLKDAQLMIQIDDSDKLVGVSELGRVCINLSELCDALETGERIPLTRYLSAASPQDKGDALIALSFLPTSQRIAVEIVKFNQLRPVRVKSAKFKLVARLLLLNESGRVVKKRKTAPVDDCASVEFNEVFQLDVGVDRWEHSVILVVVSRFCDSQSSLTSSSPPVYVHSSHVALGKHVSGHAHRIHWNSAFQNPRKSIAQWHSLS